jgi:hypothetical protein
VIIFATLLWAPNDQSFPFSRHYTTDWVERLYRSIDRNYGGDFRFIVWTDKLRTYCEPIEQRPITSPFPTYGDCVEPYAASDEAPMILMGLDTVATGNLEDLVDYAKHATVLALPRDPYNPRQACNGVALIPQGHGFVWNDWIDRREGDMDRCRSVEHVFIDDLFPGQCVHYRTGVAGSGLGDARLVYFSGEDKPGAMPRREAPWLKDHWR